MNTLSKKEKKETGSHYTPKLLSDFVADKILHLYKPVKDKIRILDPGVGDGELLLSIVKQLDISNIVNYEVCGFDTNIKAIEFATKRLREYNPNLKLNIVEENFLEYVLSNYSDYDELDLFSSNYSKADKFDIIISNPPYVRTQILGSELAQGISKKFNLTGRIDLYHAFIKGISKALINGGIAGIIVSNRFISTKSGIEIRKCILNDFQLLHLWDFGDTKIFDAAVLPAVLLVKRQYSKTEENKRYFSSIYSTHEQHCEQISKNIIDSLKFTGPVKTFDNRYFYVKHGILSNENGNGDVWRLSEAKSEIWLEKVKKNTYCRFSDLDKIRVGVKTNADKVFIRDDWDSLPKNIRPESTLLKIITTHHVANCYKPNKKNLNKKILYTHQIQNGKRTAIDFKKYPNAYNYLSQHREILENRKYLIDAGRKWYEIWVPQNPTHWSYPKLIFWDIAKEPTFWLDFDGTIVNGDCYWIPCLNKDKIDLFWLAMGVANSKFMEKYYDLRFNNKLYAGRRRFMTQYVADFPLPNPALAEAKDIIMKAKEIYSNFEPEKNDSLKEHINKLIIQVFGLKEISR